MIITPSLLPLPQSELNPANAYYPLHSGGRGPLRCDPFGVVASAVMALYGLYIAHCARNDYELLQKGREQGRGNREIVMIGSGLFKNCVNLAGTTAYIAHWLHETNVISLGKVAGAFQKISYGSSLVSGAVEMTIAFHDIYVNKQKLEATQGHQEKKLPQQIINWSLLKIAGNVSFVAASVLSLIGLSAVSATVNAAVVPLLGVGCAFFLASVQYRTTFKLQGDK